MEDYIATPSEENKNRLKELRITPSRLAAYRKGEDYEPEIGLKDYYLGSPSKIANKNPLFRYFFRRGDAAMDLLVRKRDDYSRKLAKVWELVGDKKSLEDLTELLVFGDMNEIEYGKLTDAEKNSIPQENYNQLYEQARIKKICDETGVEENVAKAYLNVRKLLRAVRLQLDKARRRPTKHSRHLTDAEIQKLQNNKFVSDIDVTNQIDNGKRLVNYVEYVNHEKIYDKVTQSALDRMKKDSAIQIIKAKEIGELNGEKLFEVKTREGIPETGNRTGYLPHCFHEYIIRVKDREGKIAESYGYGGIIGSGRTQREAIKFAEDWQKTNTLKDGEYIYIAPKVADFGELGMDESSYAPIMGDKDFYKMTENIAKNNEMKLKDAKKFVEGAVHFKNRHRFFGHFLERKGVKGYSTDIQWILRHYTNSAARYIALESEFKPQAISAFEEIFGAFDKDYTDNPTAQYCKDFINDINGNPTQLETMLNKVLNKSSVYKNFIVPAFGNRAALTMTSKVVDLTSKLTLGFWNVSSALLNLTQLINAAGYLGGWKGLLKNFNDIIQRRGKLTQKEFRILIETGVLSDIGLDTATGYDKNRNYEGAISSMWGKTKMLLDKGMYIFQGVDRMCRISTTLAAYEQAISEGKSERAAIAFAREVNRKSNFDYGANDAPNIFRRSSVIGKVLLQFKKFPIKQFEVICDMLRNKTTREQKLAFWLPYFFMCGLMGLLPAFDWLDGFIYELTGWSPKDATQKNIMKYTGKTLGKGLIYGGGALVGVDTSQRAGMADIMPHSFTDFMFGATGSKLKGFTENIIKGVAGTEEGAYANALRNVSPGLFNIYAAASGEILGNRGRKMSVYEDMHDRIIRGIGFKSVDEAMAGDIQRITSRDREQLNREKQKAVDTYISEPTAENLKRIKGLGIKPDVIKKERQRKKLDKLERIDFGETKKERQQNQYLFDFAR